MTCANCDRRAAPRSAHCWRCLKYRRRHGALPSEPPRAYGKPLDVLREAFRKLEDIGTGAANDEDFDKVETRFRVALSRYVSHRKRRS